MTLTAGAHPCAGCGNVVPAGVVYCGGCATGVSRVLRMNRVCETVAWLVVTPIWGLDRARTWTETHLRRRAA